MFSVFRYFAAQPATAEGFQDSRFLGACTRVALGYPDPSAALTRSACTLVLGLSDTHNRVLAAPLVYKLWSFTSVINPHGLPFLCWRYNPIITHLGQGWSPDQRVPHPFPCSNREIVPCFCLAAATGFTQGLLRSKVSFLVTGTPDPVSSLPSRTL